MHKLSNLIFQVLRIKRHEIIVEFFFDDITNKYVCMRLRASFVFVIDCDTT